MTHSEQPWQTHARQAHPLPRRGRRWRPSAPAVTPEAVADTPRWYRPAFVTLLAAVAVLYLWDLSASGYANTFYSAAVQAGTESWKAWFFGALDSASFRCSRRRRSRASRRQACCAPRCAGPSAVPQAAGPGPWPG